MKNKIICIAVAIFLALSLSSCGYLFPYMVGSDDNSDASVDNIKNDTSDTSKNTESENNTNNEIDDGKINVGESFEDNGLKVTVDSYNPDFTDYKNDFYAPKDGMKYIEIGFTYENIGNGSDKYVSVSDCDCYADNTICDQNHLIGDNDFYNANLSAGRNVSFKVYFEVPVSANEIELEYDSSSWNNKKVIIKLQ